MSVLFYRRPDYISKPNGPINASDCAKYVERARHLEQAIPSGLSFEEIIRNKPLPPCTLNDFMDYLVYVEHSAENLQFYLWYQEYLCRWNALSESERALSPEVQPDHVDYANLIKEKSGSRFARPSTGRPKMVAEGWNASGKSFFLDDQDEKDDTFTIAASSLGNRPLPSGADIIVQSGLRWQPFTVQPMRDECNQVIRHYLAPQSPRELNLSHRDRILVLHALQHTTHPSALAPALKVAEANLRGQSHQNFIRWSICNGNKPRIFFLQFLGISSLFTGFLLATILTLSEVSRYYRIFAFIPFLAGFTTMVATYKGLCIILHHSHQRYLRPWEQNVPESQMSMSSFDRGGLGSRAAGGRMTKMSSKTHNLDDKEVSEEWSSRSASTSMDTFGPKNSFEQERWFSEYEKTPLVRKAFMNKRVWTQSEALRVLQDKIVLGAHLWGIIISVPVTMAFLALPMGNFF